MKSGFLRRIRRWFGTAGRIPVVGVEEHLKRHPADGEIISVPSLDGPPLYRVSNVVIRSDPSVLLVSSDGRRTALTESVNYDHIRFALHKAFARNRLRSPERRPGEWMALNNLWANNFWHWVFECLPKVILAEAAGFTGHYLIPKGGQFITESLALLDIGPGRVHRSDGSSFVAETLILTGRLMVNDLFKYPALGDAVRDRLLAASSGGISEENERIYISRRKGRRALVNEPAVEALVAEYGFRKIYMEDYALKDQIRLMRSCRALLAPHGAGMTHALFMPPRSLIIELFSPAYINPTMLPTIDRFQHKYFMVPSPWNNAEDRQKPYVHGQDIEAFIEVIDITLRRELDESAKPTPSLGKVTA